MSNTFWQPGMTLEKMEELIITRALAHYRGDRNATADSLGISRRTIDNKIDKYKDDQDKAEFFLEQKRKRDEINMLRARGKYLEGSTPEENKIFEFEAYPDKAETAETQVTTLRSKKTSK